MKVTCKQCDGKGEIFGSHVGVDPCIWCNGKGSIETDKIYWKGIGKLVEECGELLQVAGKAIVFPVGEHPDKCGPVKERFESEIADVYAALDYFVMINNLDDIGIEINRNNKFRLFEKWSLNGIVHHKEQK